MTKKRLTKWLSFLLVFSLSLGALSTTALAEGELPQLDLADGNALIQVLNTPKGDPGIESEDWETSNILEYCEDGICTDEYTITYRASVKMKDQINKLLNMVKGAGLESVKFNIVLYFNENLIMPGELEVRFHNSFFVLDEDAAPGIPYEISDDGKYVTIFGSPEELRDYEHDSSEDGYAKYIIPVCLREGAEAFDLNMMLETVTLDVSNIITDGVNTDLSIVADGEITGTIVLDNDLYSQVGKSLTEQGFYGGLYDETWSTYLLENPGWNPGAHVKDCLDDIFIDANLVTTTLRGHPHPEALTVTYAANNGTDTTKPDSRKYLWGSIVSVKGHTYTNFEYSGHTFAGWTTTPERSGKMYIMAGEQLESSITENVILYAQWDPVPVTPDKYKVIYKSNNNNDQTKTDSTDYKNGDQVTVAGNSFTYSGKTFKSWNTEADGSGTTYSEGTDLTMPSHDVTLYAQWRTNSGGGGGGSKPKPKPVKEPELIVPETLNGEDHFAYVVGYPDGTVRPTANITRAEVFRLLTDDVRNDNLTYANSYADVADSIWYCAPVSTLSDLNIIHGRDDSSFDPDANITRAEFAAIASRFASENYSGATMFTDISGHWSEGNINNAASYGWVVGDGDGMFRPDDAITRAEAMTLINRVLIRIPEYSSDLLDGMTIWSDNSNVDEWYYLAVQEATNSHFYEMKNVSNFETWTDLRANRNWSVYQR